MRQIFMAFLFSVSFSAQACDINSPRVEGLLINCPYDIKTIQDKQSDENAGVIYSRAYSLKGGEGYLFDTYDVVIRQYIDGTLQELLVIDGLLSNVTVSSIGGQGDHNLIDIFKQFELDWGVTSRDIEGGIALIPQDIRIF